MILAFTCNVQQVIFVDKSEKDNGSFLVESHKREDVHLTVVSCDSCSIWTQQKYLLLNVC